MMATTRHDLTDVAFGIPFRLDSDDRLRNLRIVVAYLLRHFDTHLLIGEFDQQRKLPEAWLEPWDERVTHHFTPSDSPYFSRARSINTLARRAETPLFVMQDTDALLRPSQYVEAAAQLRSGACDLCYPYAGHVMWIPNHYVPTVQEQLSVAGIADDQFRVSDESRTIVSLVVFVDRDAFLETGMLNEHIRAWGYEDVEFDARFRKLGYAVCSLREGLVYHLDHHRGDNWGGDHPHFDANRREYEKVGAMDADELDAYVQSWPWTF